ncbi:MAG: polysaccharide export protein [Burkholderiales bacterium]|nr:polysaccharide export protein [Burkholderiales bacterium]MDE2433104.1 polysaccharide export protein [Burkholderiales bacterium]
MSCAFQRTVIGLSVAVFAAGSLTACGTFSRYPEAPSKVQTADQLYKIGALDVLDIVVWRNPELSTKVTVRPDGRISLPLVEDLQAAGRNPADLSRDIEKALSKFIREPVVTVVVNSFQGVSTEQIRIVGEAGKPQSVPFRKGLTVLDVMLQAGGLTDFADGNGAVLVRGSESGKQYSLRLKDLLKRGDISANVELMPGDIIIIPQSWF